MRIVDYNELTEKTFRTRCGDIHYWISCKRNVDRPMLVFLPGLTADHRLFERQIDYFKDRGNMFVWDAPAHASSWPFTYDFNLCDKAKWLNDILESEGVCFPVIVGQSMGGYVGQMFAELFPDKLKGYISIDSAPLKREYMTYLDIWLLKHTEQMYRAYKWKKLVKEGAKGCAETEYGRKLMEQIMMEYDSDHERYIKLVSHGYKILAEAVEADRPYEIKCPAMLICGEKDKAGSAKSYNKRWTRKSGIPIRWIKGAGHNSNTDDPEEVNRLIEEFVNALY